MWRTMRLGAFIVATLSVMAVGVFLIGKKQFLFSSTYHLKATFDNVAGLKNGAEVRVGGIHKGLVDQIQLPATPDGKVTVTMELDNSTRDIIKKDSVGSIQTEGLLGDKYMAVSFGSKEATQVQDGDTIESQPPLDFSVLIKKADLILDTTQMTVKNASEATENFRAIGAKINQGRGTVGALINDRKIYDQATAATAQAKAGAAAFQENMEALKHNWFLRGFFKKRGYTDTKELTANEIAQLPPAPSLKGFAYDAGRIFDKPEAAQLKNEKALDEAGKFLEANPFGLAVVVASTRPQGDAKTNLVLSQARAVVVREYLVKKFKMDDTRLKTLGRGEDTQTDGHAAGELEIVVYPVGVNVPPARYPASPPRES